MADPTPTLTSKIKLPPIVGQLGDLWKKQPKSRRLVAVLVLLGIAGFVAYSTVFAKSEQWTELGGGSSPEDLHELMSKLQGEGVAVRLTGDKLEVPEARADEARAIAASAGLPHTGKGFELFDGSSLGESSFTEQVKYRRALEGEIARSITSLAQVESARVHLALGKRSVFKDHEEAPSASVALHLHGGQMLTNEQVSGVRQLVAASVEGMKADGVVILDNHGNLLEAGDPSVADRKAGIERTITNRVRAMLERVVGSGRVSVVATADVDERKVEETEEIYDKDKQALRSESMSIEGPGAVAAAQAGAIGGLANGKGGNLTGTPDVAVANSLAGAGSGSGKMTEAKNYEVSRTVRQTVKPDAQLVRMHLAVVVDKGKTPRTDKELGELLALATNAAGIDDKRGDKIELREIAFAPDAEAAAAAAAATLAPPADGSIAAFIKDLPMLPVAGGLGGFIALVAMALIIRARRRNNRRQIQMAANLALPVAAKDLERMIDASPVTNELSASNAEARALPPAPMPIAKPIRERVGEAVRQDVERAASVLSAWLQEAAPRGAK